MSLEQVAPGLYFDTFDQVFICDAKVMCEHAGWVVTQETMALLYAIVKENLPVVAEALGIESLELVLVEQSANSMLDNINPEGDTQDG